MDSRRSCKPESPAATFLLIDVRPAEEFSAGHLPSARSIPLPELPARLAELPSEMLISPSRGPLCVYTDEALAQMKLTRYESGSSLNAHEWHFERLTLLLALPQAVH